MWTIQISRYLILTRFSKCFLLTGKMNLDPMVLQVWIASSFSSFGQPLGFFEWTMQVFGGPDMDLKMTSMNYNEFVLKKKNLCFEPCSPEIFKIWAFSRWFPKSWPCVLNMLLYKLCISCRTKRELVVAAPGLGMFGTFGSRQPWLPWAVCRWPWSRWSEVRWWHCNSCLASTQWRHVQVDQLASREKSNIATL